MLNSLSKYFAAPVFAEDEEKTRSAWYLNVIVLSNIPILLLFIIVRTVGGAEPLGIDNLILAAIITILTAVWFLMKAGRVRLAAYLHVSTIWLASTMIALSGSGIGTHVVEQIAMTDEVRNYQARVTPSVGRAEQEAVGDRHGLLLESIEVLPGREADAELVPDVRAVDEDPHDVVVGSGHELDPEPHRVHPVARVETGVIRREAPVGLGGVEDVAECSLVHEVRPWVVLDRVPPVAGLGTVPRHRLCIHTGRAALSDRLAED